MRQMKQKATPRTCCSPEHTLHRRRFLEGMVVGGLSVFSFSGLFSGPAFAEAAKRLWEACESLTRLRA